ncbi:MULTISPECIES: AAA family ATPase [unclassified Kitasatospora]|uniref:AAA family ATPase n=1 Tax=unclassified Kitasatospora TaxID=2633591 RepID=UPI00070CD507|nr:MULTISPECIES: AAA family ATPase [unclassified Kitasatospora]KQV16009.1 hypothetical protein ASC99_29190 [Kitasatospora sp. Root107]KRB65121.1 hypothetical protein ASE03_32600 [Kitasatospora sp. Root187]
MSGVDTVRGIAYQQAQGVLAAVEVVANLDLGSVRVEGTDDAVDIELLARDGTLRHAIQVKVRASEYTWGETALLAILRRWAALPDAAHASFEFLTDGRLGPSGQAVQRALEEAATGRSKALATLLGVNVDDPVYLALGKASIRQDPYNTGALLVRAERQVAAMLPQSRTEEDTREQATKAIDLLFRALFEYTSNSDPRLRVMDRQDIAALLGVPPEQAPAQRWEAVRERYLAAASSGSEEGLVVIQVTDAQAEPPMVIRQEEPGGGEGAEVGELLGGSGPVMLAGRTGTGKTTAVRMLRQQAAAEGEVVILAHAETYLPGRLAALTADGLASVLQEQCPTSTGAQALSDGRVTLIVDGASEVSEPTRQALGEELLAPVSAGYGARIVLVGRDDATLRSMLPTSVSPATYRMKSLQYAQQLELAQRAMTLLGGGGYGSSPAHAAVANIEKALGDAAGNPMLFSMALALLDEGTKLAGKAELYRAFLDQMAARNGAPALPAVRPALGIVYARLLNEGRRYADTYEWHQLLADAASSLSAIGMPADVQAMNDAARRCGLITSLGWDQTVVPLHDSFADFLAGAAHASGAAPLPRRLATGDDQRILFCAEIGGADNAVAALTARDLPFTTVAMAAYDHRSLDEQAPEIVASLLSCLIPKKDQTVVLSRLKDRRVLALRYHGQASDWIDNAAALRLSQTIPAVVLDEGCGPLAVATRLWRQCLLAELRQPATVSPKRPSTGQTTADALSAHTEKTALKIRQLIGLVAPPGHADRLTAQIGPLGLRAAISPPEQDALGTHIPVSYRYSDHTAIREESAGATIDRDAADGAHSTTLEHLLDSSPTATAVQRVRKALEALTLHSWLTP